MREVRIKVITNTRKESVEETSDGRLVVCVHAPRKEGRANERLRELLASHFHLPVASVHVVKGHQQSTKTVRIPDEDPLATR